MSNTFRISGLASGIDTDQMVRDLMKAHRMPLDKLKQQRQVLEWKRADYRAVNKALYDFRTGTAFAMKLSSTYTKRQATSSDSSVVTASASSSASSGTYQVTVGSLATAAYNVSTAAVSANQADKIDAAATLWSQRAKFADTGFGWINADATDAISVSLSGTTFNLTHDAIVSVASIDVDGVGYTVFTDQAAYDASGDPNKVLVNLDTGGLTFNNTINAGQTINAGYTYNTKTFRFTVTTYGDISANTQEFTVDAAQKSLNAVLADISAASALGLTAFYESGADKVSISRTATGNFNTSGEEITVGTTGFLAQVLKIDQAREQGGTDADVTVNGLALKQHSNTFPLNSVNFTLKKGGTATVTVATDTDGLVSTIKDFVDSYNALVDTIRSELQETRYPDYLPLTDDQKEKLTDRQIDQWEDKARSGLLQNDRILESALREIRTTFYGVVSGVSGKYDHLSDIGITTIDYASGGRLQVDEAKLRAAIEADPDGVKELFTKSGTTDAEKGLGVRLYDTIQKSLDKLSSQAGSFTSSTGYDNSYLGKTLQSMDSQIDRMEEHLQYLEDKYWQQFTAMEQAISRMNAQSAWLSQQFAGGR